MYRLQLLVLLVFFLLILLLGCEYRQAGAGSKQKANTLYTEEFQQLERSEQIKRCASCHQQIFDNEQSGPHAAAYERLTQHKAFVNHPSYDCDFYTRHVNEKYASDCMRCHASENLFETLFKNHRQTDSLQAVLLQFKNPPLQGRAAGNQLTGVDCFTCHFDGDGMLSARPKYKQGSEAVCNPKFSPFFQQINITCYPCHTDEYRSLTDNFALLKISPPSCNSCHLETEADGKGTHYHYWTPGKAGKGNRPMQMLVNDFHLLQHPPKGHMGVVWKNQSLPHLPGLCPELILRLQFLDKNQQIIATHELRVNRKAEYDTLMYEYFGKKWLGGIRGVLPPALGTADTFLYRQPGSKKPTSLRVSVIKKQQYWFADSLGLPVKFMANAEY
jgi:hypothetical protein